ncbi:helix-turn-helix transcriptional regulator [Anaerocolumna xylanovorans]|uniref:Predicted DNA-binding transcriptional regulator YafY, contains an HTH and WYL domains n=1 Tax=Anaerocolumna xylanovorans DSM 12503 TaxID=1121345 RepID=A0A1M7Y192_9FIRM|nr:YafY family protein [Anaerocolumna xylanovorans]SHO45521.1 Predicted DNA-binding transcriptional regulator YafY, contains an HTH and WYL domains [Anaerocolumna xylanovorans DSM 12503]
MKIDRLLGILTILLQNDQVTAPWLADRFEVSRRTIGRDIDALCMAGIPIVTHQGGGGGISILEGYKLDKSILTAEELTGIIAALKGIGSVSDSSQIERTLDKLSGCKDAVISLQEPIVIDLASHYKGNLTPKISQIKQAVLKQRIIEFDYYYDKGITHRKIEPYFVIFQWSAWYVFGFCMEKQDWRLFKLARLWELKTCDESYIPKKVPEERKDFNAYLPDDKHMLAVFEPSVRYQLIEEYGPDCYSEREDGKLLAEIGYTKREHMISWLLGFGNKVKVLEPEDLAEEVKQTAVNILKIYP